MINTDKAKGCLLGLAVGDAVGTTLEFLPRHRIKKPLTDMVGGGPFNLAPGQWTDDTSMALCLAESLLQCGGFDARDQMERYSRWWLDGYMSSNGTCFDIGDTCMNALADFQNTGEPYSGSDHAGTAGNGSIMRLAPIALFYRNLCDVEQYSELSSKTTHAEPRCLQCARLLGRVLHRALLGEDKKAVLADDPGLYEHSEVKAIARCEYLSKFREQIMGSGYVVRSLEAALWCFAKTNSFRDAVLVAANLGDDADTTAAITGQIAGAFYGKECIPVEWMKRLTEASMIEQVAVDLCLSNV